MDLSLLSTKKLSEEGTVLEVLDPRSGDALTSDGVPVTITLTGIDGGKYRDYQRKIQNRRLKAIGKGKTKLDLDAEELEKEGLDLLVECTVGWTGISWKGAELLFTPENAKTIYSELGWLRDQVDAYIGDRQNFFTKPTNSSSSTSVSR